MYSRRKIINTITSGAIFGAIAGILYILASYLSLGLPFAPSFMEIHFDEVPLLICAIGHGPVSAILALFVRLGLKLIFKGTSTMFVGELADLIYSIAFILPVAFIYKKAKNIKGLSIGLGIGVIAQLIVAMLANSFVIFPFYAYLYHMDVVAICHKVNSNITDLYGSLMLYLVLPFNLIKDAMVVVLTIAIYAPLRSVINRYSYDTDSGENKVKVNDKFIITISIISLVIILLLVVFFRVIL